MTRHTYPKTFLRKRKYHVITNFKGIGNCFLLRYSDANYPYYTIEELRGRLDKHLGASQIMTGISTILLCRLKKKHLHHLIIKPVRNSTDEIDIRRGGYFKDCTGIPLCPMQEDLYYSTKVKYFGVKIADVVRNPVYVEIKDKNKKDVTIRTDELRFEVRHSPNRSNFWHCDIVMRGKDGDTGEVFDPTLLNREGLDSKNKVMKKATALISLFENEIRLSEDVERKTIPWHLYSDLPIGRKAKKHF